MWCHDNYYMIEKQNLYGSEKRVLEYIKKDRCTTLYRPLYRNLCIPLPLQSVLNPVSIHINIDLAQNFLPEARIIVDVKIERDLLH